MTIVTAFDTLYKNAKPLHMQYDVITVAKLRYSPGPRIRIFCSFRSGFGIFSTEIRNFEGIFCVGP